MSNLLPLSQIRLPSITMSRKSTPCSICRCRLQPPKLFQLSTTVTITFLSIRRIKSGNGDVPIPCSSRASRSILHASYNFFSDHPVLLVSHASLALYTEWLGPNSDKELLGCENLALETRGVYIGMDVNDMRILFELVVVMRETGGQNLCTTTSSDFFQRGFGPSCSRSIHSPFS